MNWDEPVTYRNLAWIIGGLIVGEWIGKILVAVLY